MMPKAKRTAGPPTPKLPIHTTRAPRVGVAPIPTWVRYDELKWMLIERERQIVDEVQCKIRDVRAACSERDHDVLDSGETSEVDIQEDIEFALIQMKTEALTKIREALSRLEKGTYGRCFECGEEIAQPRLRALPFAVRCRDCEEAHEMARQRGHLQARRGLSSLGFEAAGTTPSQPPGERQ